MRIKVDEEEQAAVSREVKTEGITEMKTETTRDESTENCEKVKKRVRGRALWTQFPRAPALWD